MIDTKACYNVIKESYNKNTYHEKYRKNRTLTVTETSLLDSLVNKMSGTPMSVLDVGCGDAGLYDMYLRRKKCEITGIDISEEQIRRAYYNLPASKFICDNFVEMHKPSFVDKFDCVICMDTLSHFIGTDLLHAIKKMYQYLKPGGVGLLSVRKECLKDNNELRYKEDWCGAPMYWNLPGSIKVLMLLSDEGFQTKVYPNPDNEDYVFVTLQKQDKVEECAMLKSNVVTADNCPRVRFNMITNSTLDCAVIVLDREVRLVWQTVYDEHKALIYVGRLPKSIGTPLTCEYGHTARKNPILISGTQKVLMFDTASDSSEVERLSFFEVDSSNKLVEALTLLRSMCVRQHRDMNWPNEPQEIREYNHTLTVLNLGDMLKILSGEYSYISGPSKNEAPGSNIVFVTPLPLPTDGEAFSRCPNTVGNPNLTWNVFSTLLRNIGVVDETLITDSAD